MYLVPLTNDMQNQQPVNTTFSNTIKDKRKNTLLLPFGQSKSFQGAHWIRGYEYTTNQALSHQVSGSPSCHQYLKSYPTSLPLEPRKKTYHQYKYIEVSHNENLDFNNNLQDTHKNENFNREQSIMVNKKTNYHNYTGNTIK